MQIAYIDLETDRDNHHILDMGAICGQQHIHTTHLPELLNGIQAADFLCGHHFLHHDFPHLQAHLAQLNFHAQDVIDTLLLSPLLFPARPYHALDKDYKTQFAESNNPLTDCLITRDLLDSEQQAFFRLPENLQTIFYQLLGQTNGFAAFFRSMGFQAACNHLAQLIRQTFSEQICHHAPLNDLIAQYPTALAYALSLIHCQQRHSIFPTWLTHQHPELASILRQLRGTPCAEHCPYCQTHLNAERHLQKYFAYPALQAGDTLLANGEMCCDLSGNAVGYFSKKFREKLAHYQKSRYQISHAEVNFIVLWHNKENDETSRIVLPIVYLRR